MFSRYSARPVQWAVALAIMFGMGCGGTVGLFNPAFVNTFQGGLFPLAPGPTAPFVMVRCVNETGQTAEFLVTIERLVLELDENGSPVLQPDGTPVTRTEVERKRLQAQANAPANEIGVLFDCEESPVVRVGLGENLLPTDAAIFIGGGGAGGFPGFGVTAENLNPLTTAADNFTCGDAIIFRAFQSAGTAGGVAIESFVLAGSTQAGVYAGPDTFANYAALLQSQQQEGP